MARIRNRGRWGFEDAIIDARAAEPAMVEMLATADAFDPLRLPAAFKRAPPTRRSRRAARSRTTMPWPARSPPRCAARRPRSTRGVS